MATVLLKIFLRTSGNGLLLKLIVYCDSHANSLAKHIRVSYQSCQHDRYAERNGPNTPGEMCRISIQGKNIEDDNRLGIGTLLAQAYSHWQVLVRNTQ